RRAHPTAEWIANQVTEACGWEQAPRYLIRDRDGAYGEVLIRRLRSIGIRDRPTSPRSPWQNGYAERLIGSIRRECLDHVIVFSERHLRHLLLCYMKYYNGTRTHLCADFARRRTSRAHSLPPNSRRATPPICPDLIYDRHRAGCCAKAADESVRTATDAAAIMSVRIMDFLPVRTARAGRMRRYVLMTSTKRMPVDFQNARPPTAPTLSLKNRTSARPADSSLITLS